MNIPSWQTRLDSVLRSWSGTPWMKGQCCKGRGVDCWFFVVGVLDELYRITPPLPPRLPLDTAINNRPGAVAAIKSLTDRYPTSKAVGDVEPGDVVIVRNPATRWGTLQHAMIVGLNSQFWHAGTGGVGFTSLVGWSVERIFRPLNKETWA